MKPAVEQVFKLSYQFRKGEAPPKSAQTCLTKRQVKNLSPKRGFTLMEVMLALAILVGAIVVLGEFGRMGLRCAKTSRDLTRAELLCESIMSEIVAGILAPDPVQGQQVVDPVLGTPVSDTQTDDVAPWVYSIESETIDQDGLMSVTVTVQQDMPITQRPVSFTLVRWIPDPNLELLGAAAQSQSSTTGGTTASGSSTQGSSTQGSGTQGSGTQNTGTK